MCVPCCCMGFEDSDSYCSMQGDIQVHPVRVASLHEGCAVMVGDLTAPGDQHDMPFPLRFQ